MDQFLQLGGKITDIIERLFQGPTTSQSAQTGTLDSADAEQISLSPLQQEMRNLRANHNAWRANYDDEIKQLMAKHDAMLANHDALLANHGDQIKQLRAEIVDLKESQNALQSSVTFIFELHVLNAATLVVRGATQKRALSRHPKNKSSTSYKPVGKDMFNY